MTDKSDTGESALRDAEATLAKLKDKRAKLARRGEEIAEQRKALAFEASTRGGPARKQLTDLNREAAAFKLDLEDLDVAIGHAERNVGAAQSVVEAAALRERSAKVTALADEYEKVGADAHIAFLTAFEKLRDGSRLRGQISALGGGVPEWMSVRSAIDRAIATYMLKLLHPQLIPGLPAPNQREGIDEAFRGFAEVVRRSALRMIAGAAPKKKEAA
jgi:chromosome segregation ATPase